jgi:hypothetical protein
VDRSTLLTLSPWSLFRGEGNGWRAHLGGSWQACLVMAIQGKDIAADNGSQVLSIM